MDKWIKRWKVPSNSNPDKEPYTVAIDAEGNYGCSCPHWIYRKKECGHIRQVKAGGGIEAEEPRPLPVIRYANVQEVTLDEQDNIVKVPLRVPGDAEMAATIVYDLMCLGYSYTALRDQGFSICKDNTRGTIVNHVLARGRTIYGPWVENRGYTGREVVEPTVRLTP